MEFFHVKSEEITESSGLDLRYSYEKAPSARLNQERYKGWVSNPEVENPFLQIDLGNERVKVTAVATQGGHSSSGMILKYKLSFSNDQLHWFDYRDEWKSKIFEANRSDFIATKNYLTYPVKTRFIRFWPKETKKRGALRVEVYGCRGCSQSLISDKVKLFTVTNISIVPWTKQLKLNNAKPENTWCGDSSQFLRLDFGSMKEVRTIFMLGHPTEEKWVTKFLLRYSNDGMFFTNFTTYWNTKVLLGNSQRLGVVKLDIDPRLAARFVEIHPVEFSTKACMRIEIYGDDDCAEPLGMENHLILDDDIKATSWITVDESSSQARLNNVYGEGAWCPRVSNTDQYLEINLHLVHQITRIATQGRYPLPDCLAGDYWVTKYTIQYTVNGYTWKDYQQNDAKKVFTGNMDSLNVAVNQLTQPIKAKGLRIQPIQWNKGICMRVELYGCKENFLPVGLEDYRIPSHFINFRDILENFRLNSPYLPKRKYSDCLYGHTDYITIYLGPIPFKLNAVAKQCKNNHPDCTTKYALSFSLNDGEWFDYMEDGKRRVFEDSYLDFKSAKLSHFKYEIKARYVRFWSLVNYGPPCFQLELYGLRVDNSALGLSTGIIPNSALTASSQENGFEAVNARLDSTFTKSWCAATPVQNEFLKIDIGRVVIVSQVAIGRLISGKGRVYEFWMSFSIDEKIFEVYNEDRTGRKVFKTFQQDIASTNEACYHVMRFPFRARFVKVHPISFNSQAPCLTLELYGKEDCQDELGISDWRLPNAAMTASSSMNNNYLPWMGRVGNNDIGGAWCARYNGVDHFLQIDLGSQHKIQKVFVQGKEKISELNPNLPEAWVKSFSLSSSRDGYNWTFINHTMFEVKIFEGNTNEYEVVSVNISTEMTGRFVRIHPKTWHNHICMRVELIGCEECAKALGMENWKIPSRCLHSSSHTRHTPAYRARLNLYIVNNFCTHIGAVGQFLIIDLGPALKVVSGVAVQSRGFSNQYISKFAFWYSRDGIDHVPYLQDGKEKIFQGSIGWHDTIKHHFNYTIVPRSVKIIVKDFNSQACFRVELYGCYGCDKSSSVLTDYTLTASSQRAGHTVDKAKVAVIDSAWCATTADSTPYLKATFTAFTIISQIVTMGHPVTGEYVKIYQIQYSDDGSMWISYKQDMSESSFGKDIYREASMMDAFIHELQDPIKTKHLKISFSNTAGQLCLKVAFYGHEVCKADLGLEEHIIPDSALTASSSRSIHHSPAHARLNRHLGHGAWCSKKQTAGEYLQVDLNIVHKIIRLALQAKLKSVGSNDIEAWITGFTLKYSQDGSLWSDYKVNSKIKSFVGITNKQETLGVNLSPALVGQFIRIVISSWQNRICLRLELYGCKVCAEPLGLGNFKLPDKRFTGDNRNPYYGRLTLYRRVIYAPNFYREKPFLQVDLGGQRKVTAVATSGYKEAFNLGYTYAIEHSLDGANWKNYTENSAIKLFSGATQGHIVRHYFSKKITCQHVRLVFKKWLYYMYVAAEFFGC